MPLALTRLIDEFCIDIYDLGRQDRATREELIVPENFRRVLVAKSEEEQTQISNAIDAGSLLQQLMVAAESQGKGTYNLVIRVDEDGEVGLGFYKTSS